MNLLKNMSTSCCTMSSVLVSGREINLIISKKLLHLIILCLHLPGSESKFSVRDTYLGQQNNNRLSSTQYFPLFFLIVYFI